VALVVKAAFPCDVGNEFVGFFKHFSCSVQSGDGDVPSR
jgi:hypothetical protein